MDKFLLIRKSLGLLPDIIEVIRLSARATIYAILTDPSLLLRPLDIRRIIMAEAWKSFGPGIDENSKEIKQKLITPHAIGVVLDIGAGHGHTALYLDPSKVTKYVAVEPNVAMHPYIRTIAAQAGFTEDSSEHTLLVLPYGAEQTSLILSALDGQQVDTVVSILALCSIPPSPSPSSATASLPSPKNTLRSLLTSLLAPGGKFLFCEHVRSPRADIARIQEFWAPLWAMVFDGCVVGRPTDIWVHELGIVGSADAVGGDSEEEALWCEGETEGLEGESEEHLFWHQVGKFVKRRD